MIRLLALCLGLVATPAPAELSLSAPRILEWEGAEDWFGGWSGIEVLDGGARAFVISDRGVIAQVRMDRDGGVLIQATVTDARPVRSADGRALPKHARDLEGLVVSPDGRIDVSFEHDHRLMRLDPASGELSSRRDIPFPLDLNIGMEALALGPTGAFYTIAEARPRGAAPLTLYAEQDGRWRIAARLPHRKPFVPVGADFDDKGRFWLLERAATPLGFRSRLRVFRPEGESLREHILLTTGPGEFDNLEGVSLWRGPDGVLRVTLVSDDNFLWLQRNQIVEFDVTE